MKQIKRILFILLASASGLMNAQDITNVNIKTDSTDIKSDEVLRGFNIKGNRQSNTAAISTVTNEQFRSSTLNPGNALYGMLSGLSVMQGNRVAWDNTPDMSVRGVGTMNVFAPLVLVDGFERPFSALTQEEIETVSVLKDAAALALYGMRGANGVVLVKTKRGAYDSMKVTASYQFGVNTPYRLPKMANAYEYANAMNEALKQDGLAYPRYDAQELEAFRTGSNPELFPDVDWTKEALRDYGFTHQVTASFRGGSQRIHYYSMLHYEGDDGLLKPVDLNPDYNSQMSWDRLSLRTNLDITLTKSTQLKLNLLGQISSFNRPATNYPVLFNNLYNVPSAAFPVKTSTGVWGGDNIHKNPVAEISAGGFASSSDRALLADMRIEQDLSDWVKGLSAEVAVAFDNRSSYWDAKTKSYLYETIAYQRDNNGNVGDITRTRYGQETDLAFSSELGFQNRVSTLEAKLNYGNAWREHSFNTSVIFHNEENSLKGPNNTYRRQSLIGNANYGFKDKYFVDVALSYSGSSVLNAGDRYRLFPAVSGAWLISSEDFMKSLSAVNYLKIRASWGITGSDIMAYDLGKYYFTMKGYNYYFGANNNGAAGHTEGRLANLNLNPEMSYKTNVGVELRLFNRLSLTADIFYDKRTNILVSSGSLFSSVIGVDTPLLNAGEVVNKGFEVSAIWEDSMNDWTYSIGGNFSFARNKINNMNEEYQPEEYLKRTGHRIGQFFGLESIGYFNDEADTKSGPEHSYSQVSAGDVKYKDQNNDNIINDYDMVAQGYSTVLPEIYYGLNLRLGYKGFGLKADFQGIANYSVVKTGAMYRALLNNTTVSKHYLENRWTPGSKDAKYPRLSTLENANNYVASSVWLENGAFLKLRNIELSYSLPKSFAGKIKAQKVQLFARGENLFSFDHVKELDPEMMRASYPSFSSYHIGLSLDF